MGDFNAKKWFKNQYIKEHVIQEGITVNLNDLTFDMVTDTFKDKYQNIHFTRIQPDGKEGPYYKDAVHFPNASDSLTQIGDMSAFESWKEGTLQKYGKVDVELFPEENTWFDKVKIKDEKFQKDKDDYVQAKGNWIEKERAAGRFTGLDEIDMNDPVLVKARAAKMADEKEKAKQAALNKKYGSSFMDKLDAEIGLKQELQDLKDERAQLMIDMEQEAEPEGGEIADEYGSRLNDIDAKMSVIKSELDDLRMYESINEENEKWDKIARDEYGKPWMELSIAQKQELLSYMNRETEKQFQTDYEKRRRETSDYMNEGASTEEKRIAMRAIKSIAKYRGVSEDEARNDLMRAVKELGSLKEAIIDFKETIELGKNLNEELCAAGKAYRKRRMAAGEKSSAYLSGRAVKVCKGQMSGRKKKK